ncbi:MAG: crossover junction endodeoxyribonuclease RuvC [Deltaproteobacteria bacterium]|nr:crossover junction endodeoxyribonuclease RuvC [Deltaproteobacteria bacterium]
MRVLGIDPGSRIVGYGLVEVDEAAGGPAALRYVECGVIQPRAQGSFPQRLREIAVGLREVLADLGPTEVAVESVFVQRSVGAALKLGQARGVALLCAAEAGLPIHEYAPARVKKAVTGNGAASKAQVQQMVRALVGLKRPPRSDAADALAVAICHAFGVGARSRRLRPGAAVAATRSSPLTCGGGSE